VSTVTPAAIHAARARIAPWVRATPFVPSPSLSALCGASVFLKLETMHEIGAFKIRGATNCIASLDAEARTRGVVTVSTGNHGRAVARAARWMGVRAVVCLSSLVPRNKVQGIEGLGAEARIIGHSQDEAEVEARRLAVEEGMTLIHPFDDPAVIAGQGTIGLEVLEQLGRVDAVLCPLSGGGLIGGVAIAVKESCPQARLIGISMERGAAMIRSLEAGHPVPVAEEPTLADSLGGGIGLDNRYTFDLVRQLVDATALLSEEQIADGMRHLYREERLVAEGGGAVGVAALLHGRAGRLDGNVVVIVSGRNVDMEVFARVVGA
jgi:threonine dehydratase